ncbi:hypothetical protein [Candidatus Thiosymbion oneisti]|uniref:hypothetical protein n=1 Tax=Candidatus Thiosymbion oneisti TaxID=589554 RepID=UPI00114D2888|nr:hypothetical protein [Candidatus Thiosymbion oneisti]
MMKHTIIVACLSALGLLSGCASINPNMPLVFGQSHAFGLSVTGSTLNQGIGFTIGYQDKDIALIPVTVKQPHGEYAMIKSNTRDGHRDALSVLGQFDSNSKVGSNANPNTLEANVGLGKFFATGIAAQKLADGFAHKLGAPPSSDALGVP